MVFSCILTFRFFICLPDKQFFVNFFLGDQKWPLKSCSTLENVRGWKVMWLIMSRYLAKISYLNFVALAKLQKHLTWYDPSVPDCLSSKMETLIIYNIINTIFSCIAFLSNLGSLIYIIKSFDIKQSFFYILCLDAILVMISAFVSLIMFSIAISGKTLDEISCSFLFMGSQITVLTSPMCNFMVSYIR